MDLARVRVDFNSQTEDGLVVLRRARFINEVGDIPTVGQPIVAFDPDQNTCHGSVISVDDRLVTVQLDADTFRSAPIRPVAEGATTRQVTVTHLGARAFTTFEVAPSGVDSERPVAYG